MSEVLRDLTLTEMKAIEEICKKNLSLIEKCKRVSEDHDEIKDRMTRFRRNVSIKLAKGEGWNDQEVREHRKVLLVAEKLLEKEKAFLEKGLQVLVARIAEDEYKDQEKKAFKFKA